MTCSFNKTNLLRCEFGEHFISRSGPVNWPPRSYDLIPFACFMWSYIKAYVYTDKPVSIAALEDTIEAFIREITAENWTKQMDLTRIRGKHLHEIIFKH